MWKKNRFYEHIAMWAIALCSFCLKYVLVFPMQFHIATLFHVEICLTDRWPPNLIFLVFFKCHSRNNYMIHKGERKIEEMH